MNSAGLRESSIRLMHCAASGESLCCCSTHSSPPFNTALSAANSDPCASSSIETWRRPKAIRPNTAFPSRRRWRPVAAPLAGAGLLHLSLRRDRSAALPPPCGLRYAHILVQAGQNCMRFRWVPAPSCGGGLGWGVAPCRSRWRGNMRLRFPSARPPTPARPIWTGDKGGGSAGRIKEGGRAALGDKRDATHSITSPVRATSHPARPHKRGRVR